MEEAKPRTGELNGRLWGARAQDWADLQEGISRPIYEAVFDRLGVTTGTRYLDAGCGAGMAAQMAASRGARVSGIDAAQALIRIASSRTPSADFRVGDLEALPFDDAEFDAVAGFNSFQYAGNPVLALREARRVMKPSGAVVVVTWGDPDGMEATTLVAAMRALIPPPPPGAPGPFALSAAGALKTFAAGAGLTPVEVFDVSAPFDYPDLATAIRALNASGGSVRVMELSSEQAVSDAYAKALAPFRQSNGSYHVSANFRCLLARP